MRQNSRNSTDRPGPEPVSTPTALGNVEKREDGAKDLRHQGSVALRDCAGRVREFLLETIPVVGGHLGAGLGVVELTVALHSVFDFAERDTLVWDVGHQCYPHKVLTGRASSFDSLRRSGGLSGFPDPAESEYDTVKTGHGGTSISTAFGFAVRNARRGWNTRRAVAVIGDGALQEGNAFEALNHAGTFERLGLIVVLNDNGMAISRSVGAMGRAFARPPLVGRRHAAADLADLFGFAYVGPVDGHDIDALRAALRRARFHRAPVLVHAITEKGRGAAGAEADRTRVHAVAGRRAVVSDAAEYPLQDGPTFTAAFGETACAIAAADERVVAVTAAMTDGTGLGEFASRFPERFFDVGMAEQHAVALAASMALAGLRPLCCIYSTFLQRAFDQLFQEVALQNAPVIFCVDRAGLVGNDGATHNGVFDIAFTRCLPNFTVLAPRDTGDLARMIAQAVTSATGPVLIRYPRGQSRRVEARVSSRGGLGLDRGEVLIDGDDGCILSIGPMAYTALEARRHAQRTMGKHLAVVDARSAKPLDFDLIAAQLRRQPVVFTVEDHVQAGGFGSAVSELAATMTTGRVAPIIPLALPDRFIDHGERAQQLRAAGLDVAGVTASLGRVLAVGC